MSQDEAGRDADDAQSCNPSGLWGDLAKTVIAQAEDRRNDLGLWLHVSYMNFSTLHFSTLQMIPAEQIGEMQVLTVPEVPCIAIDLASFSEGLDFALPLTATWYSILSDKIVLPAADMLPNRIEVVQMDLAVLPPLYVWKGSTLEKQDRDEHERQQRARQAKRKANSGARARGGGRRNHNRGRGQPAVLADASDHDADGSASDHEPDASLQFAPDDEPAWQVAAGWADFLPDGELERDPPDQPQPMPPAMPPPMPPPSEPPPAEEPEPLVPPDDPATVFRRKEVAEVTVVVPDLGDLRYNPRTNCITAHCSSGQHGDCRKQRTCKAAASRNVLVNGQGRPLGYLMAWLQEQNKHNTCYDHVHYAQPLERDRVAGRVLFMTLPGAEQFSLFERNRVDDEADEPSVMR